MKTWDNTKEKTYWTLRFRLRDIIQKRAGSIQDKVRWRTWAPILEQCRREMSLTIGDTMIGVQDEQ